MIGKQIRMERIIDRNTNRTVIVPMDHGVSSGPIYGITDLRDAIEQVVRGGATPLLNTKVWWVLATAEAVKTSA